MKFKRSAKRANLMWLEIGLAVLLAIAVATGVLAGVDDGGRVTCLFGCDPEPLPQG